MLYLAGSSIDAAVEGEGLATRTAEYAVDAVLDQLIDELLSDVQTELYFRRSGRRLGPIPQNGVVPWDGNGLEIGGTSDS